MLPIDDNEAFRIRANAGDGPDCDVNPLEPVKLTTPLPPEVPCDTPPEPEVETFFTPAPAPKLSRQLRLPAPLTLHSPRIQLTCPPDTARHYEDDPTVLEFGATTRTLNFSDIEVNGQPLFDQATLYNLASVSATIQASIYNFLGEYAPGEEPARSAHIASGLPGKIAEVISITKLSEAIVTAFWQFILTKQAELDTATLEMAARQRDCGWFNTDLWVVCYDRDESEYRISVSESTAPGAVFVPAGTAFSSISQEVANQLAVKSATGIVACQFENTEQTASCLDLFGGDFSDEILFSWPTLDQPETTKISDLGGHLVLDAGGNKTDASVTGLKVLTHGEVATRGASAAQRELILSVTVPAGATTAATQAEADAKARALALTYLDCFIPARQRHLQCTDAVMSSAAHAQALATSELEVLSEIATGYTTLGDLLPIIKPDNTTFVDGPALDERVAVRMILPAGAFVAETRQAADALAASFILSAASAKLDCRWRNRPVTYACDDIFKNPDDFAEHLSDEFYASHGGNNYPGAFKLSFKEGQIVDIAALGRGGNGTRTELMASVQLSDPYSVEVARGEFESATDQESADKIAAAHAMAQLNCVYCNPKVNPHCPPTEPYTGELPLPITLEDYSFDTTRGAPGVPYHYDTSVTPPRWRINTDGSGNIPMTTPDAWICDSVPSEVARVVDDVSTTPLRTVDTDEECRFCNDYITAACCADPTPGAPPVMHTKFTNPDQCLQLATAFNDFATQDCAGNQISDPYAIIAIPECSMFGSSKQEANELALNIAWAQLNCLFANTEQTAECLSDCESMAGQQFTVQLGGHTYTGLHGENVFVGVETAKVESGLYKSACSQEQADKQAKAAAEAQVVCLWGNNEQTAHCPPQGSNIYHSAAVTSASIPEGTIVSDKCTTYANGIALNLAIVQLFCVYTNERQCAGCAPIGRSRTFEASDNAGTLHIGTCQEEDEAPSSFDGTCIEPDTIITTIHTPYANTLARMLLPVIPCTYCSNPVDVSCEPRGVPADSSVLSAHVDRCEIEATQLCIATETAFRLAVAQLICLWTNTVQVGECLVNGGPRNYTASDSVGNSYSGSCADELKSENSPETVIIPQGTVITPLGTDVANQMAKGMLPSLPCIWCSNPVEVTCMPRGIPHSSAVLRASSGVCSMESSTFCEASEIAFRTTVAQLICLWTNEQQSADCSVNGGPRRYMAADNLGDLHGSACVAEDKSPDSPGVEIIPQGTIATPLGTAVANEMAKNMLPNVPCIWCSNPAIADCVPKGIPHSSAVLSAEVPYCSVESSTLCEASEIAFRTAVAQLVCLWTNETQIEADCPPKFQLVSAGVVPQGTICAPSTAVANVIAKGIAISLRVCEPIIYYNDEQIGDKDCDICEEEIKHTIPKDTIPSWDSKQDANDIAKKIADALTFCIPIPGCGGAGWSSSDGSSGSSGSGGSSGGPSSGSEPSSGSDPSSGGDPSGPSVPSGSPSGSDKSTAIVPVDWNETGYAALFVLEAPEVRFDDVVTLKVTARKSIHLIDPKYLSVCERGSIRVCGWTSDKLLSGLAVRVVNNRLYVEVSTPWYRRGTLPCDVTLRLTGIRKGFKGKRFPARTHEQFEANERFINSAYPSSETP